MKKIKYYDALEVSERDKELNSNVGDVWHIDYIGRYDHDGNIELVETGKTYIPDLIDADRESCDINNIIKKFVNGDTTVLQQRNGFYGDVSEIPTNYAEMLNLINKATDEFNRLPLEVKEKYDFDVNKFICSLDDYSVSNNVVGFDSVGSVQETTVEDNSADSKSA